MEVPVPEKSEFISDYCEGSKCSDHCENGMTFIP